jgi:hypothetical protein
MGGGGGGGGARRAKTCKAVQIQWCNFMGSLRERPPHAEVGAPQLQRCCAVVFSPENIRLCP